MKLYQRALIAGAFLAGLAGAKYLIGDEKTVAVTKMEICDAIDNDCVDEINHLLKEATKLRDFPKFELPDHSGSMSMEDILKAFENKRKYEGTL